MSLWFVNWTCTMICELYYDMWSGRVLVMNCTMNLWFVNWWCCFAYQIHMLWYCSLTPICHKLCCSLIYMEIYILQQHIHRIPDTRRVPGGHGYGSIFLPDWLGGYGYLYKGRVWYRVGYYYTRTQPDPLPSLSATQRRSSTRRELEGERGGAAGLGTDTESHRWRPSWRASREGVRPEEEDEGEKERRGWG